MHHLNLAWTFLCASTLSIGLTAAQDKSPVKFGKVTPADFDLSKFSYDTSAAAVVIADVGNSYFEGNNRGWFSLVFKRSTRIKILSKKGLDAGTIQVPVFIVGSVEEKVENLKAATYNLENGKVTETKLDDNSVYTDKFSRQIMLKKFSLPNMKEGSIIEFSYVIHSDFLSNLQPWTFQGIYPCLWSEYETTIPEYFTYVVLGQGFQPFHINSTTTTTGSFSITTSGGTGMIPLTPSENVHRWVMKDVPALNAEKFTTTINNYVAKVEFQESMISLPNGYSQNIMQNWSKVSEDLLKNDYFGADLSSNNGWLDDDLHTAIKGTSTELEKAEKIYEWIRHTFRCTNHGSLYMDNTLKNVFKNRSGDEASINLLLTSMLNHADIQADPVILSTRGHGYPNEVYPIMSKFNYVICSAKIDDRVYYLDASQPKLTFGFITNECYNGQARVINKDNPTAVYFLADSLQEKKITTVFITNDDKGGSMSGNYSSQFGYMQSYELREIVSRNSEQDYFKNIITSRPDMTITNTGIDSLNELEMPATVHYDFRFPAEDEIIYFEPMLAEGYKENPFKSSDRKYPVEIPYAMDETYVFTMEIPKGYVVDELPKSAKVSLNSDEGFFEYMIDKDEASIQMHTRIRLNKANFEPADYSTLRDFFAFVVQKEGEQIVFKKKK